MSDKIIVTGANENNLKNVSFDIEKHKFNVVTGVSGSGKSSLVFDCIYSMAQAAFYETLSTYIVKNLPKINKPNVEKIENLSPCVLIEQKRLGQNPRSTVGTYTEIYTYLRLLYSRIGYPIMDSDCFSFNTPKGACRRCNGIGIELKIDLSKLIDYDKSLNEGAIRHRTWKVGSRYFNILQAINYFDMDKKIRNYTEEEMNMLLYKEPTQYMNKVVGYIQSYSYEGIISRILKRQADSRGLAINEYDKTFFTQTVCLECQGSRLNKNAREVKVAGKTLIEVLNMELVDLYNFIDSIDDVIAIDIVMKIKKDLKNLIDLGIGYLTLNRGINTLSSGESQKIKLSKSLNNTLNELIYIMDEPSLGFHSKDVKNIVQAIKELVSKNNTAIVVEHNRQVIQSADNIIDIGPDAGKNGGTVIYNGDISGILNDKTSITGKYLKEKKGINDLKRSIEGYYEVKNVNINNISNQNVNIPLNLLTCITGISGSGKSSLIKYILEHNSQVIKIGKDNIAVSNRSNVATYTKTFDIIRELFAKENNVSASKFSFNSSGACSNCNGTGIIKMDMHFLGNIKQVCDVCNGKRYESEVLKYLYKEKNINDVLEMTVEEAILFFDDNEILKRLKILKEVGLEYLKLGQTLDTLSGGEVQRVNMSKYLTQKGNIYVFDEPTQGLHLRDIELLNKIMQKLIKKGNTVIVVEHNLDFIMNADYIIDMGPEAGKNGGKVIFSGFLSDILSENTYTGRAINEYLYSK